MQEEYYEDDEALFEYAERPNKTQIKREIAAISAMAEEICELTEAQIDTLNLPDELQLALLEAAKMPHKGARKRQLKYITAQLRKMDIGALQEKLARLKSQSAHAVREHHQAERWRDQLLGENGHQQLTQLLDKFPHADGQHLRQLMRNAGKELKAEKAPKSARLLYRYLKELIESAN
ncbi:ribosome biogenesis factor YjgA [Methylomarinum sp. Ch1-1]|uniref:Dual-action ribosomal maturation protein DarP n=1 Tax=Methylomarinum roseum TaxID=3067653 RepID=A0AAU7NVE4_9GAMM|nr:ribosome biogenesis factor YjgA [Methylomarinum sp. Ch1-1]MDP4523037.1 ribosome biogenesis factor YjgA [Methylomarinum sp. Ch1-1]